MDLDDRIDKLFQVIIIDPCIKIDGIGIFHDFHGGVVLNIKRLYVFLHIGIGIGAIFVHALNGVPILFLSIELFYESGPFGFGLGAMRAPGDPKEVNCDRFLDLLGIGGMYVLLLKKVSDTLLSIYDLTDDKFGGSSDNYSTLIQAPANFAIMCLSVSPLPKQYPQESYWKEVLAVLYNKKQIQSYEWMDGAFMEEDNGQAVRIPKLTTEEKSIIAPFATTVPKEMEIKFHAYPPAPKDPNFYEWRKAWKEGDVVCCLLRFCERRR